MGATRSGKRVIGLLINQIEGRYQSVICRGLSDFARTRGVTLRIYAGRSLGSPYGNEDLFNRIYGLARSDNSEPRPDGLVVTAGSIGSFVSPETVKDFLESFKPIPLATIGISIPGYPGFVANNADGMSELIRHLVSSHGFRRFAFLKGPEGSPDAVERYEAWRQTLTACGVGESDRVVYSGDFSYGSSTEIASRLDLSSPLPFDVISCANDDMALGFIRALERRGVYCPRDYAITGFDDIPESGFLSPLLTTVHQPLYEQAFGVGALILDMIEGKTPGDILSLPCVETIRESCGCSDIPLIVTRRKSADRDEGDESVRIKASALALLARERQFPEPIQAQAAEALAALCDSASLDLRKFTERSLFLQTLSGWLEVTYGWKEFSTLWQTILSILSRELVASLGDTRSRAYAEDLFASAYALLTRKAGEIHARDLSSLRNTLALFRDLSVRLGAVESVEALLSQLCQMAPLIGFTRVSVALHASGAKPIGDDGESFYDDVKLHECADAPKGADSIRLPLLGRDASFGYVVLEGNGLDPVVYESLRDQISQTLEALAMRDKRNDAEGALRESEERYREIASAVPIMILETDVMLKITYKNLTAREGLSLGEDDIPVSLKSHLAAEDRGLVDDIVKRIAKEREIDYPNVRLISERQRRYIPVVRITGRFDRKGNLTGLRWNALDPLPFLKNDLLPEKTFFDEHRITERERTIVELQLQNYRIKDIADRLFIAESTVKGHLTQVYNKLGISGKSELLDLLAEDQAAKMGLSAYVFSLVNRVLSLDEE